MIYAGGFKIPEIRQNYLTDEKVIIAKIRAKRPKDIPSSAEEKQDVKCPFCKDSGIKLSPAKLVYVKSDDGSITKEVENEDVSYDNWIIKVIPNLYPVFTREDNAGSNTTGFLKSESAFGFHEVVLDTPEHTNYFHLMNSEDVINLFKVYRDRFDALSHEEGIEYISISKNHGPNSGGTLMHPHSQILASKIMPTSILKELSSIEQEEECVFEKILQFERKSLRFILENEYSIAIAPFASVTPYEVWVFPKQHVNNITKLDDNQLENIALTTRDITRAITQNWSKPSYNLIFNQTIKQEKYHMYIRILPRFYFETGFEISYNLPVNEVPPEEAAQEIRKFFGG
ncbi:MAG: galactose-1-phosphate uridylyltransferase [Candidatus Odinarchaeia archaeon]